MRFAIRALSSLALCFLVYSGEARAQSFVYVGPAQHGPHISFLPPANYALPSIGAPRVLPGGTYAPLYDYYAAPYPLPARIYAGYNSTAFAFHGQTYGHHYEPYTWAGLSRYPAYPPIRVSGFVGP